MTREEAIERLKTDIYKYADFTENPNENEFWMAFDLAIKALDQEPTTKNNLEVDCVARQDIERYIEGFINEYTPKEELEFINLELDGLKHLPSVTPQEPILDKIRAEIDKARFIDKDTRIAKNALASGLEVAMQIIDKYKGESEK